MTPFSLIDPIVPRGARARGPEVLGPRRRLPVLADVPRPRPAHPRVIAAPRVATATSTLRSDISLDTLLTGTWNEISLTGESTCPVCAGEMRAVPGGGVARCGGCGSELS
jgi:hypothetical protein